MNRLVLQELPLKGLRAVTRERLGDSRGFLSRVFCAQELADAGWEKPIAQINHTFTARRGIVRGMHFQRPPSAEMKLVTCLRGEVWDVAVDLRAGSSTFLRWHAVNLSGENGRALLLPEGFAHGFQALTDEVELLYCHSAPYVPRDEGGLNPRDQRLAIAWPLTISEVSDKDSGHPLLDDEFAGIPL